MRVAVNLSITIATLALCLVAAEFSLRATLDRNSAYGVWFLPEYNEIRYRWSFVDAIGDRQPIWDAFDPELGWNVPIPIVAQSSASGSEVGQAPLRVLFVGDSFIRGNGVKAEETLAAVLTETMSNIETVNMGVSGYGIDQSVLKLERDGLAADPDVIVLGIHPPNYERASVSFFSGPKPLLELDDNGQLISRNSPLAWPSHDFASELRQSLMWRSHLWDYGNIAVQRFVRTLRERNIESYFKRMDAIVEALFRKSKSLTEAADAQLIVLQIPHGNTFRDQETRTGWLRDYPVAKRLRKLYQNTELPALDLDEAFLKLRPMREVFDRYYRHPVSPEDAGHLSVEGNRVAAEILTAFICGPDSPVKSARMREHCR